ncbi:ABC transporter substrate-binding protein [Streptosporangium roseum]|uniref:ABC transporter substrate-binding protein n=1 Tax=Streptosporangium roseum TaxID=2001 RepID=UPI0004CD2F8F|nr:ABC transporter substrate-binding protein [Streptosporangium roseum]
MKIHQALCAAVLLLAGCAQVPAPSTAKDTLVWANTSPVRSLDIAHGFDTASTLAQFAMLDTPVTLDKAGTVVPSLAESWKETKPGVYDFKLRSGVTFSDGTPLTADDVAFSLRRHLDPKVASEAASYFTTVKSAEATGPGVVRVVLRRPNATFLATAAIGWQVVSRKLAEAHPKDLGSPDVGTLGTGPYKVARYSITDGLTLVRNEHYWGKQPALSKIEVKAIEDPEARRLAIASGDVEATMDIPIPDVRKWTGLRGVTTGFYPSNNLAFLSLDVTAGPLKDVHVRRAIAHAVDREALARVGTAGHGQLIPALLTTPQFKTLYDNRVQQVAGKLRTYGHDLAAAKAELAQSAYPDGFSITVPYAPVENPLVIQAVIADLAKIGIKLTLENQPEDAYRARLMSHDRVGIHFADLGYSTPDPGEVLPDLLSRASTQEGGWNFSMYASAELDERLDKTLAATDPAKADLVTAVLAEVADQVPYIPLYCIDQAYALNKKFTADINAWTVDVFSAIRPTAA